ncbi:MAG: hypothetical protein HFI39_01785 [Lachnospiraceae bacterium]|nr:hypothetical protein [Lachnospiraceae bacterium]
MEYTSKDILLYLNIPFCLRTPAYGRRHLLTGPGEARAEYLQALEQELLSVAEDLAGCTVQAVYVGGGSPSIVSADGLGHLLLTLRRRLHLSAACEVSLEAIPNTIGVPSLSGWAAGHPTRIHLNIQSINPQELKTLNCPFGVQDIQNAILYLDKFHINNVNLNLTYGIPGQTRITWKQTLRSALELEPFHITISPLPAAGVGEEEQWEYYQLACEYLAENGFQPYSVNQFTVNRAYSRYHYLKYLGCPVMGLGLDARSVWDGYVYTNTSDYRRYILHSAQPQEIIENPQKAGSAYQSDRFLYHRLCLLDGFTARDYQETFGCDLPEEARARLAQWQEQGLLEQNEDRFRLTLRGRFYWKRG